MIIIIKFNDQLERKQTGWNGFLVVQTTVKRHKNKNKKTKINQQTIIKITEK